MKNLQKLNIVVSFLFIIFRLPISLLLLLYPGFNRVELILFLFLIGASDCLDGYFAGMSQKDSPLRRALDSFMDRIALNSFFICLVIYHELPFIYYLPLLVREILLISGGSALFFSRLKIAVFTNWIPKAVNVTLGIAAITFMYLPTPLWQAVFVLTHVFIFIGLVDYTGIYIKVVHNQTQNQTWRGIYPKAFEGISFIITKCLKEKETAIYANGSLQSRAVCPPKNFSLRADDV